MSIATPSRRGLLTASAWAVPSVVLASATPAFATSTSGPGTVKKCVNVSYLYNWSQSSWAYQGTGTATAGTAGGVGIGYASLVRTAPVGVTQDRLKVTVQNSFSGNATGLVNTNGKNMVVPTHNVGGLGTRGLEMYQGIKTGTARATAAERSLDAQTIVVTFDRPVTGLTFSITDIDSNNNQFADRVELSGNFTTSSKGANITGSGTSALPWASSTSGNIDHVSDNKGNVKVAFNGSVTSFVLKFWNADNGDGSSRTLTGNGAQAIFLSNFNFTASTCV